MQVESVEIGPIFCFHIFNFYCIKYCHSEHVLFKLEHLRVTFL